MFDPSKTAAPGQQSAGAPQAKATICIAALADGTFKVYPEAYAGAAEQAGETGGQIAPDVDAALELAKQMLSGGEAGAPAEDSADALFQQGFNKVSGNPLNRA